MVTLSYIKESQKKLFNEIVDNVGVSSDILNAFINREIVAYETFTIKKRSSNKRRYISVPSGDLKKIQKWINTNILDNIQSSPYSYAFEKGKSIVSCAEEHKRCRWLIKIDVKNFFESLSEKQVYNFFITEGYSKSVAFALARLTTRGYKKREGGYIPQGASTSPKLANLVVRDLDLKISELAKNYELFYTRYADDMAFSTKKRSFDYKKAKRFLKEVFNLLRDFGLKPNYSKTKISAPGKRKSVLGLLVDTNKVRLQREFREKLKCDWFFYIKNKNSSNLENHAHNRGFYTVQELHRHIVGVVAFAKQVDKGFVMRLEKKYGKLS